MRKRKPENSQAGQSKLYKFFNRIVDNSDKNGSSKSEEAAGKCPEDFSHPKHHAIAEKSPIRSSNKSSSRVSPKTDKNKCFSPNKINNTPKDVLDVYDCCEDILPPTPKRIKSKFVIGSSRFTKKSNVNIPIAKNSIQIDVSDNSTSEDRILSVQSPKILLVKEVVNQDNLCDPKYEKTNSCNPDLKENECLENKISCKLRTSQNDGFVSSENLHSSVCSVVPIAKCLPSTSETKEKSLYPSSEFKKSKHEFKEEVDECMEELFEDWDYSSNDHTLDSKIEELQLDSIKRCKVVSVCDGPGNNSKTLVLTSTKTKQMAKCVLRGVWAMSSKVVPGDVINIRCNSKSEDLWILGNETQGSLSKEMDLLVENPDTLISGTSVVGSLFCPRKSVLADRFRGFETSSLPLSLMNDPNISTESSSADAGVIDTKVHNSARIMLVGSLVHELLQTSLQGNLHTGSDISKAAYEILHCHKTAADMYAAQVELHDIKKEVLNFVPSISSFMQNFVTGCKTSEKPDVWGKGENKHDAREWKGSICTVKDIEENLWVPSLGLKGKIDVTVLVKIHPRSQKGKLHKEMSKEMPLELKTGRNTYSPEHQGQVLLYCMMMSALAAESGGDYSVIDSGLLLYLREESMREINAGKYETRDLIMLRNELAHFLSRGPAISNEGDLDKLIDYRNNKKSFNSSKIPISLPELPEPIHHKRACSNCPYLTICSAHLKCNNDLDSISKNHPMSLLAVQALKHLKSTHLEYFVHWSSLVSLEYEECRQESKDHFLWTMEALEREKQGRCLSHLVVTDVKFVSGKEMELCDNVFIEGHVHSLVRAETFKPPSELVDGSSPSDAVTGTRLQTLMFNVGERVLISSDKRVALSSGVVVSLTPDVMCLCFDRNITSRYGRGQFHVDKYDYLSTSCAFCLTSMGLLLEDNWSATRLRELIIDRREAQFIKKLDGRVIIKCSSFLKKLNHSQSRAVLRALSAKDYLLVRGLPGTGKTATIVAMIQVFVAMGKSVLLTGHSHSSVDTVMTRLVDQGLGNSLIRLGRATSQINVNLKPYSESVLTEHCLSPQDIEKVYQSKMIVGVTCMGSSHPLLCSRAFDVCILDEAGQILLPISLRPIMSAKVFVLVGDPQQLPPVVRGHRARILGLEETLFNTLDSSSEASVTLDLQYRMNSVIAKLANDLSYGSSLVCANDEVANATLCIPKQKELIDQYHEDKWLHAPISVEINNSVMFLDTGNTYNLVNEEFYPKSLENNFDPKMRENICKYMNVSEAALIHYVVKAFVLGGVDPSKIGVIAPYKDQVALLKKILKNIPGSSNNSSKANIVEINTVDQYQGKDKEIILYSFTRSGNSSGENSKSKELELLSNKHRLTVAITRAKVKLICVGHVEMLKTYAILQDFMSFIPENSQVTLCDGENGFSWRKIFSSLNE